MEQNSQDKNYDSFPEDRDAPHITERRSLFKEFYKKFHCQIDLVLFVLVSLSTLITVSFSLYIVIVNLKY